MDHDESFRLHGRWLSRTVADVVELFRGYSGQWWIAGGWAIEAFTNIARPHSDIDPSIPRSDTSLFRAHFHERYDIWVADQGSLRPLEGLSGGVPLSCNNLWLRASQSKLWEYDLLLMDAGPAGWFYKRDPRVRLPFDQILWTKDGVRYLRPEVQLLFKAPGLRRQDQLDFDAALPLLDAPARHWLRTALQTAHPEHPWANALS
ncbi:hypothetical protein ABS642_10815 [Microbacterium sp. A8/3-1]|uniref:Amino acid transporter n=1 Tax=Microbacterium sp. A8/3-1 TaxID=3160749 RepID=A0AAU7W530_9MICO